MERGSGERGERAQRRKRDGLIQYLVKTGSDAHWINSNELSSPEDKKEVEIFLV